MRITKTILLSHDASCPRQAALLAQGRGAFTDNFFARQGREVTLAAARFFKAGATIPELPTEDAARATEAALADGKLVAEATFAGKDCTVRCDLARIKDGELLVTEIKSSTYKQENIDKHLDDAAAQVAILERGGRRVKSISIALLNPEAAGPSSPELFIDTDVTAAATGRAQELSIDAVAATLAGNEPARKFCKSCAKCEFFRACWPEYPERHATVNIPNIRYPKLEQLHSAAIFDGKEVSSNFLTDRQQRTVSCWQTGDAFVDGQKFDNDFPMLREGMFHFLDFEAAAPAIPLFDKHRPYQTLPFQFSLHTALLAPDNSVTIKNHRDFLHTKQTDPTGFFMRALVKELSQDDYPVVVYSGYEARLLDTVGKVEPQFADAAKQISGRFIDLHKAVSNHVVHPDMNGLTSIKVVLPAFAPGFNYDHLDIQDGIKAVDVWMQLRKAKIADTAAARNLRQYCARDTEAMIHVLQGILKAKERQNNNEYER